MKKGNQVREEININNLIESFCKKYETLITFVSADEIELMFREVVSEMPVFPDFNPEFQANFLVERKFFLKAKDEVNAGNIDLEILIVDKYLSTVKFMLRQLKYIGNDLDKIAEAAIIDCIENYDGNEGFKNSIVKSIKKFLNSSKEKEGTSKIIEESHQEINSNQELIITNDGIIRKPNQLELLIHSVDILSQVPLEDDIYLKFISLKYGYYQNQYFGLGEIAQILSITLDESKEYYFRTLEYVKNWFGLQLDKMYIYYIQKSE